MKPGIARSARAAAVAMLLAIAVACAAAASPDARSGPGATAAGAAAPGSGDRTPTPQARNIRVHGLVMTLGPDGEPVPVVNATVWVDDEDWDPFDGTTYWAIAGTAYTDENGEFDVTCFWDPGFLDEQNPDISVSAHAFDLRSSGDVFMLNPDVDDHWNEYVLRAATRDDYTGTDLDMGTILAGTERRQQAFFIYTTVMRGRQWIMDNVSSDFDGIDLNVRFPTTLAASEIPGSADLELTAADAADEAAILRELARKWHRTNGQHLPPDLVNGVCDGAGHGFCLWCAENDHDAWEQGFCQWFGRVLVDELTELYGESPFVPIDLESLALCNGVLNAPTLTAGFVGALLHDIQDFEQDDHPGYAQGIDDLALGYNEILAVVDLDQPAGVLEFLDAFHARYPQHCEGLWLTAKNCGFDRDAAAPGPPSFLTSPSHPVQSTSPDATVLFTWTSASDDMSCIDGYAYSVTAGGAHLPAAVKAMEAVTSFTTPPLDPGTWFFNLRSVDNAGRWSASYTSYGPFTISPTEPANLAYEVPVGWAKPLVPRATGDATANAVPTPTTLTGNAAATYWNAAGRNTGALATSGSFAVRLYVDGVFNSSSTVPAVGGGAAFNRLNRGPMTVRGGRHTYEALLDGNETISETDETDNRWAEQWIWTPLQLTAGSQVIRSAPPDRTAGWDAIAPGPPLYYNCDGLRLTTTGWWNAVTVRALDDAVDYDCRLHVASSSPLPAAGGFGANAGYSARAAGDVDAVLVNRNVMGNGSWDVGVLNAGGGASQYAVRQEVSQTHPFGTRVTVPLAQDQLILLREFHVGLADLGWVDIQVDVAPQDGPVEVLYLDRAFSTGDLLDFAAHQRTSLAGHARIQTNIGTEGYACVAVYRDPQNGLGPIDVTIQIGRTPPDYRPYQSAGWHAPLVPRPDDDANAGATPAPATLAGNAAATWLNLAVTNDSQADATIPLPGRLHLDAAPLAIGNFGTLAAHQIQLVNNDGPYTIAGGRHTLFLLLDPDLAQPEISETNNVYGEQWIWSPLQLSLGAPQSRPRPPFPEGGLGYVRSGEPFYFDCDGLRTPAFASHGAEGYWGAVAVMPGPSSNADLRLHPISLGPKDGFAESLAESYWPTGESDFVIVNFNVVPFAAFDAGVSQALGSEAYTAEVVDSHHLGLHPNGTFGPFAIEANRIVDVHEVWLDPGVYICRLENVSGAVDWGFSLYPRGLGYLAKSDVVPGAASWQRGGGELEAFHVEIAQADYYAFAVWKVGSADLPQEGSYRLVIHSGATDVPGAESPPARTAIVGIHPNPFNPRTTIAYDLRDAGAVQVRILDARGVLVRALWAESQAAGRHELVWDGTDDRGRAVASGVYVLHLSAGAANEVRKLVLLK